MFGSVTIFGGTGFVGSHFCRYLLENKLAERIFLADLKPLNEEQITNSTFQEYIKKGKIIFRQADVRQIKTFVELPEDTDLIVNFAAIHREPGHEVYEYFETNLYGAENVCAWADTIGCRRIVFMCISPYGPSDEVRNENSLPVPITPYGSSKLVAEKIHMRWKAAEKGRKLLIVRPGVIFGPGEGGNVTRLLRALIGRYFFYMGNKNTRKAGGYVKELCSTMIWALEIMEDKGIDSFLYNFTMDPAPSVGEYVETICQVSGIKRRIPRVPFLMLNSLAHLIEGGASILGVQQPISPVRIKKLVRSNHISPGVLREYGYQYRFSLQEALEDWKSENPQDWS